MYYTFWTCILQDMIKRRIIPIYKYYTLTLNVVKCFTPFYPVFYRTWSIEGSYLFTFITLIHFMLSNVLHFLTLYLTGHGQQEDLYGHDDGSCQKPETQAVYFPYSTKHEVSIYILKNILGKLTFIFLLLQIEEELCAIFCFLCQQLLSTLVLSVSDFRLLSG